MPLGWLWKEGETQPAQLLLPGAQISRAWKSCVGGDGSSGSPSMGKEPGASDLW